MDTAIRKAARIAGLEDVETLLLHVRHTIMFVNPGEVKIQNVAFDSTGRLLAAGSTDGTIEIWDTANPGHTVPLALLADASGGQSGQDAFAVAFSPDGHTIAAGSQDATTHLWRVTPTSAAAYVCAISGTPITRTEWSQYIPGRPYDPPCRPA